MKCKKRTKNEVWKLRLFFSGKFEQGAIRIIRRNKT